MLFALLPVVFLELIHGLVKRTTNYYQIQNTTALVTMPMHESFRIIADFVVEPATWTTFLLAYIESMLQR